MAKQACAGQSLSSAAAIRTFYEIQRERMTAAMGIPKECALGCNARTYNPICNAHSKKTQPIPEPAPELCAYKDCREVRCDAVHRCIASCPKPCPRNTLGCHPFVAPQAKLMSAAQQQIAEAVKAANQQAKPVLREPKPAKDIPSAPLTGSAEHHQRPQETKLHTAPARGGEAAVTKPGCRLGVACKVHAPAIEPWRPTVDEWDLLADAETGWRR